MKKILTLILAAGMSFSVFAFDIFNYVPPKGNAKSSEKTIYDIYSKFGTYVRSVNSKITRLYDENGREYNYQETSAKGKLVNDIQTTYDEDGNISAQKCTNSDSEIVWQHEFSYKDGKKTDLSEYDKNHVLFSKTIYTYENDKLKDETSYNKDGDLVSKTIYKYAEDGKIAVESDYFSNGSLAERRTYTYTADGKIDFITVFAGFTNSQTKQVFRYNVAGLLNEITFYGENNEISSRVIIKYDDKENVIRVSEYKISFKFDSTQTELVQLEEISYVY